MSALTSFSWPVMVLIIEVQEMGFARESRIPTFAASRGLVRQIDGWEGTGFPKGAADGGLMMLLYFGGIAWSAGCFEGKN